MNVSHFKLHFLSVITTVTVITPGLTCLYPGEQQLQVKGSRWTLVNSGWFHNHLLRSCKAELQIRLTHEHTHDIHQHNKQLVLLELWHDCDLLGSSGLEWNSSDSCDSRCAFFRVSCVTWGKVRWWCNASTLAQRNLTDASERNAWRVKTEPRTVWSDFTRPGTRPLLTSSVFSHTQELRI